VTGGAGFIGSHLVDALLERGARVRVLDSFATGRRSNLESCLGSIELIEGDLRVMDDCQKACQGAELVFHFAALGSVPRSVKDPATTIDVNVGGTANVFAAARDAGVRRVVYASSSSIYGDSMVLPKREGEEGTPLSPYALSKAMDEDLGAVFSRCYGMELAGLRFFNVYGPRQDPDGPYAAVVPRLFKAILSGEAPTVYGDGEQSRDFTYVADAVRAALLAAGASPVDSTRGYNVAGGRSVTVNALVSMIRELAGKGTDAVHLPERQGDVRHSLADPARSFAQLGFLAEVPVALGLEWTSQFFRGQHTGASR
jgi:nucleoside-diphosphate-sugar epimerase